VSGEQKAFEVHDALAKYFQLSLGEVRFARCVTGIRRVYEKIKAGLSARYEIVIFHPTSKKFGGALNKTAGYVAPKRVTPDVRAAGPIRRLFGFPTEWNHEPWEGHDVQDMGRIHLSLAYVNGDLRSSDQHIARTIIHEASHKFARTTDVIYKSETFRKMGLSDEQLTELQWNAPEAARLGADRPKPLYQMAGQKLEDPERLLENADSYAWTARRLWKRFRLQY
jgi:hypothetical protein